MLLEACTRGWDHHSRDSGHSLGFALWLHRPASDVPRLPRVGRRPGGICGDPLLPLVPLASRRHLLLQCITNSTRERRINSSLQLPDRVLNFLKDHFLMDGQVRSRMLLLQPQARYQRVAVHRVAGLHRTYDILFLGTSECQRPGGRGGRARVAEGRGA